MAAGGTCHGFNCNPAYCTHAAAYLPAASKPSVLSFSSTRSRHWLLRFATAIDAFIAALSRRLRPIAPLQLHAVVIAYRRDRGLWCLRRARLGRDASPQRHDRQTFRGLLVNLEPRRRRALVREHALAAQVFGRCLGHHDKLAPSRQERRVAVAKLTRVGAGHEIEENRSLALAQERRRAQATTLAAHVGDDIRSLVGFAAGLSHWEGFPAPDRLCFRRILPSFLGSKRS